MWEIWLTDPMINLRGFKNNIELQQDLEADRMTKDTEIGRIKYARRYMSNGMIHIQWPFRKFVHAFNKF